MDVKGKDVSKSFITTAVTTNVVGNLTLLVEAQIRLDSLKVKGILDKREVYALQKTTCSLIDIIGKREAII